MERWRITEKLPAIFGAAISAYLLYELSFSAASKGARKLVKERAGESCESCGIGGVNLVVGHMDHTSNGEKYNDPENLHLLCLACEAFRHLDHIGSAKQIGLSEKDNRSSAYSNLTSLAMESIDRFNEAYFKKRRKAKIDDLFRYYMTDYRRFVTNIGLKPKQKTKKQKSYHNNPKPRRQ